MPHYVIDLQTKGETSPRPLGWFCLAADAAEAEAKAVARIPGAINVRARPARAFEDAPRYRGSGKRIPTAYIEALGDARGVPAGPVATVFLNDAGSREISPAREKLAADLLTFLNQERPALDYEALYRRLKSEALALADEMESAISTHLYDEDNGDVIPEDCSYTQAVAAVRAAAGEADDDEAPPPARDYLYFPENCPSKHQNDGNDVCEDCGADLNGPSEDQAETTDHESAIGRAAFEDGEVLGLDTDGSVIQWNGDDGVRNNSGETPEQFGIENMTDVERARCGLES